MCRFGVSRRFAALLLITSLHSVPGRAQEADTVLLQGAQSRLTILSQIEDPREAHAFLIAYDATEPAARHQAAQSFIDAYPQSWLLAQASDLAAKASIDLGDYAKAIQEARFSLRLLPENATLLVLLANAEARTNLPEQAARDAADALQYVDEFEGPANLSEGDWKHVRSQLKASAYFAVGRAYGAQGLATSGSPREQSLTRALDALDRAAAWNPADREIFYLRGVLGLAMLNPNRAAEGDLAFVAKISDELGEKALRTLRVCYRIQQREAQVSFPEYLASLPKPKIDRELCADARHTKPAPAILGGYSGPSVCQSCHPREFDTWKETGMAKMLRPYRPENIIGDFSPGTTFQEDSGNVAIRLGNDSRPYLEVLSETGAWQRFHVDYTIGSKWQQAYATALPDGRFQVLPIEYNLLQKKWINYWKIIDPPGSPRTVINQFPRLSAATNYQQNCAICHTSQLLAANGQPDSMEHASFLQPGVDCEMCHGPSAWHVQQARSGKSIGKKAAEPPVDFRTLDNREGVRICGQCHRQSAVRAIGQNGEMNYRVEDTGFVSEARSRQYDAFSRRAFYKDGRFRETTFIVEAFTRSACYRKGTAQCATCHAPHLGDFAANQTALKFKSEPDAMCLGCHGQYRENLGEHTHHPITAEASRCVSCHMPRIMNSVLFQARSHQIEIPQADLTKRFGQADSPNACLLCHSEKDASWVEQQLIRWKS